MPLLKIDRRQHWWLLISQLLIAVIMGVLLAASNYQTTQAASLTPQLDNTYCTDPGMLVDVYPINANGSKIGEIDLYYNRANGGYNCVWTRTVGDAYRKAQHITITIDGCDSNEGENCLADGHDDDIGDYHTYAGPAVVTEASGACISVKGTITWGGATYEAGTNGKAAHCGK